MTEAIENSGSLPQRLSARQVELMVRGIAALPTFPGVVAAVAEQAGDIVPGEHEGAGGALAGIVSCDPPLTATFLKMANADTLRATTLGEALAYIPASTVWSTVMSADLLEPDDRDRDALDRVGFWEHSIAVACAAASLAADSGIVQPELAFTCGLLHDIGKLVLAEYLPKSYARVVEMAATHRGDIGQFERAVIGTDHAAAGRQLAQHWQLGAVAQDCIWLCHQPLEAIPTRLPHARTIALVTLADTLVRELRIGFSGTEAAPRSADERAQRLGLPPADLQRAREQVPPLTERRMALIGLDRPQDAALHRAALAATRGVLADINDTLDRRLQWADHRADAFDTLGAIITPAGDRRNLWEFLGTAAEALATDRDAGMAYAIEADTGDLLVVRAGDRGREERAVALAPEARQADTHDPAALAELLAGVDGMEDWLGDEGFEHCPLLDGGQWIGGVMTSPVDARARKSTRILAALLGPALGLMLAKGRATDLGDQLAGSSQLLAATQDALTEARTLAAVGEMAAGAAHELNNPLAVVSGRAQLMREKAESQQDRATWELIAEQAQRISDIITELMDYASPPAPVLEEVAAGPLIDEALEAFNSSDHVQAGKLQVDIHLGAHASAVRADREQMRRVIAELITNAATAIADRDDPAVRISARDDELGDTVLLSVADNGPGMDEATLQRAFTPFFSLQQAGRRRGLGLPRAKRYVEIGGGKIWIRPGRDKGTTVYLQLPRAQ